MWEAHTVRTLPSGQTQLLIGLHLIHEVTTPQAFQEAGAAIEATAGTLPYVKGY